MRRTLLTRLLGLAAAVTLLVAGYISYRTGQMNRLYGEAVGYPGYFRDSHLSLDAVKRLDTYHGSRATAMLLDIALHPGDLAAFAGVQTEAIEALSKRGDTQVGVAVAELLQPNEGLNTKKAAAAALQALPCNRECVRSVMYYLERVWRGEPNFDERWVYTPDDPVGAELTKDQQALYEDLDGLLRREKLATLTDLVQNMGLEVAALPLSGLRWSRAWDFMRHVLCCASQAARLPPWTPNSIRPRGRRCKQPSSPSSASEVTARDQRLRLCCRGQVHDRRRCLHLRLRRVETRLVKLYRTRSRQSYGAGWQRRPAERRSGTARTNAPQVIPRVSATLPRRSDI